MNEATRLSKEELEVWLDPRLDKAAEEIGYAIGMMIMSLLAKLPTPEDPDTHSRALPGLQRITAALEGRFARMAADGFTEAVRFLLPAVRPKR